MTTPPAAFTRVKKARHTSTCPACRGPILPGQQIALSGYWQHVQHVIDRNAKDSTEDGREPGQ
jgi:hypothetical protein